MKRGMVGIVVAVAVLFAGAASGGEIFIKNASFEDDFIPWLESPGWAYSNGVVVRDMAVWDSSRVIVNDTTAGWLYSGSTIHAGARHPTAADYPNEVPDGHIVVYCWGGTFYQILDTDLASNTEYTLSVWAGWRVNNGAFDENGRLELWADGTRLAYEILVKPDTMGEFAQTVLTFTTGADVAPGQKLEVHVVASGTGVVEFDDVKLFATAIPEPATMTLLALGTLTVLRRRK